MITKVVVWLLLCLIWGSTWFVIKIGLRDLPPLSFAWMRFVSAGVILLALTRLQGIPLPRSRGEWKLVALTGFLQFTVNYSAVFWSEQYISSGLASLLQASIPAFGLVMAWVHLPDEKITASKIAAVGLGLTGVAAIFVEQLRVDSLLAFAGSVAVVAGAFAAAESSILIKRGGASLHPAGLLFGQMVCGLAPLLLAGLIKEGSPAGFRWTGRAVFAVLYLATVGTIAAFWLFYWLLRRVESTKAMTIALVTPLVAVAVGAAALGERLRPQTYLGGALILGSVCLVTLRGRRESGDPGRPSPGDEAGAPHAPDSGRRRAARASDGGVGRVRKGA